ncbi:hypothetical protein [Thermomonas paludicola]|uniref:hypothetical protein n=1 Tax=Thermomonas paludicola TaxID=2884874 RepID=UPI002113A759|nr:hypothetical protein [Thermomonas paludicola]
MMTILNRATGRGDIGGSQHVHAASAAHSQDVIHRGATPATGRARPFIHRAGSAGQEKQQLAAVS